MAGEKQWRERGWVFRLFHATPYGSLGPREAGLGVRSQGPLSCHHLAVPSAMLELKYK